jgi:glycosyltransferase involved in cell wall biosynthesis/tetratricopeptide (TPR) repeat protein
MVLLNGRTYSHKEGEFKPFFHKEYNHLKLFPDAGHLERHIGLLNDLIETTNNNNNNNNNNKDGKCVLECLGSSHGLFVPAGCAAAYDSVWVSDLNESVSGSDLSDLSNLNQGIPLSPFAVYVAPTYTGPVIGTEAAYVLCPSSVVTTGLPHSFVFPLTNDPLGYVLCVPQERFTAFQESFKFFFDGSGAFVYDNLIHLCIMVKNGGEMFEKVLTENLPIIDRWTILDTGSTDGTQDVVRRVLAGKKGQLFEEPFLNFRDSRNRCLDLASTACKFTLMLDDTYAVRGDLRSFLNTVRSDQVANSFSLLILSDDMEYYSNRILKAADKLRYIYTIHEVIQQKDNVPVVIPKEAATIFDYRADYMEKRTMDRKRYDLDRLFDMLKEDPTNPRHLYYLGQTYNLLEDWTNAAKYFELRATSELEGFKQEAVDSYFELARLYNFKLGKPWDLCEETYKKAFDLDPSRPESLYFIGVHYLLEGQNAIAFDYFKRGFLLGYPVHAQFSLKPTLSYYFLPKFLAPLCYEFKDYRLGLQVTQRFLTKGLAVMKETIHNNGNVVIRDWYTIFEHLCKMNLLTIPDEPGKPFLVFVADGGWAPWTGKDLLTKGMGGSETYIIEMARHIQKAGSYNVIVFCYCTAVEVFEDVVYTPIQTFHQFVSTTHIQSCIVSRFSEYIPMAIRGHVENVYFILHDLGPTGQIIPLHPKLKKVFCLTDWHKQHFLTHFPTCESRTAVMSYGLDQSRFTRGTKRPHSFLYSSFPSRGLLPLLQMWPRIVEHWPDATLDVFCDLDHAWSNRVFREGILAIRELLASGLQGVVVRGWVSKAELADAWSTTDIWLYPCTFQETFCLTALEAAYSGCLVVCSDLAALQNTVGDRGVVVEGDPMTTEWQQTALKKLFGLGVEEKERLIETNRMWASGLTWEGQANLLLEQYLKPTLTTAAAVTAVTAVPVAPVTAVPVAPVTAVPVTAVPVPPNATVAPVAPDATAVPVAPDAPDAPVTAVPVAPGINVADMYNWTHDAPSGSRAIIEQMLRRHQGPGVRILEIGTYAGTSLIEMLKILPDATGVAIDRWTNYEEDGHASLQMLEERKIESVFYENLRSAGVSGRVEALKGDSVIRLLDLIEQKERFDFVYIVGKPGLSNNSTRQTASGEYVDGSHKCIDCYTDMALSWRLLKRGGTMVVDDYLYQAEVVYSPKKTEDKPLDYPKKGIDHFLSKYEGQYRVLDVGYKICLEKW